MLMRQVDCARCFEPMRSLHTPDICPECRDCLRYHCDGEWYVCDKCEAGGYWPKSPGMCACDDCWFVARPRARKLMTRILATVPREDSPELPPERRCRRGHLLGPEDPLCEPCVEAYLEAGRTVSVRECGGCGRMLSTGATCGLCVDHYGMDPPW